MKAIPTIGLVFIALGTVSGAAETGDDQQAANGPPGAAVAHEKPADEFAAQQRAQIISQNAERLSEQLDHLLSELDTAESRQKTLIERHRRLTQYGNYSNPELKRLDQPLRQGYERVRALRTQTKRARSLVRTLSKLDATLGAASAAENVLEGAQFLKAANTLSNIGGASREQARAYQHTVDQVLAQNDLYSPTSFMLKLRSDCSSGIAALATCAGLGFNTFSRLVANLAVQEAAVEQMIDSSSEIIASRIKAYGELGAQHAREGRSAGFDSLDRPAILDVEVLARSADNVISLLDSRSLWVKWLRGSKHKDLREAAEALKRDLAEGAQSSVMSQFRSVYQAAYESASIEMEIQQIDGRITQLVPQIEELSGRLQQTAEQVQDLMKALEESAQEEPIEDPIEDPSEEQRRDSCEEALEQGYAPYAQPDDACDPPVNELEETEESPSTEEPAEEAMTSRSCRLLDRPLPAGLSSTEHCGIVRPQPGNQQFLAACQGNDRKNTHTCTVVYCNHVFYRWGAEDIIDCVEKIAAQKDRQAR